MKEIEITNPERLLELLSCSLSDASIVSPALNSEVENIHQELNTKKLTDEDYLHHLNHRIAEYVYMKYQAVYVTSLDIVVGVLEDGSRENLFDGTDCKVYMDARCEEI